MESSEMFRLLEMAGDQCNDAVKELTKEVKNLKSERLTLARAVNEYYLEDSGECIYCEELLYIEDIKIKNGHKPDCPVLLAEAVIKEDEDGM